MRNKGGFTPRELAVATACQLLKDFISRPDDEDESPAFNKEYNRQLAMLHNKILDKHGYGLDAMLIPVEEARRATAS